MSQTIYTQQLCEVLAMGGNSNHWQHWLSALESRIRERGQFKGGLCDDVDYVCWLLLAVEQICYSIRSYSYKESSLTDPRIFDCKYSDLPKKVASEIKEDVWYVVHVRNIVIHKGFPNPHKCPSDKEGSETNGYLDEERVWTICNEMKNRENFEIIKARFEKVNKWLRDNRRPDDYHWAGHEQREC